MKRTFLLLGLALAACLSSPEILRAADGDAAKPDPAKQFRYGFDPGVNAFNFEVEPEERFLERFAARDDWESVSIRVDGFSDRILERIAQCPTIREFGLIELTGRGGRTVVNRLTDQGMAKLAALPNLKIARFNSNHVGGATVKAMAGSPALETFYISGSRITENPITDDDLAALGQSRSLCSLGLEYSHGEKPVFTARGLEGLARCRTLERLTLFLVDSGFNVNPANDLGGDRILGALAPLTGLKELSLPGIPLNEGQVARIAKTWPMLEELTINASTLGDEGLSALAGLASLKRLWLDGGDYTDKGIVALRGNRALRKLALYTLPEAVTPAGMKALADDSPITELSLSLSKTLANTDEGQRIPALFPRLESLSLFRDVSPVGVQTLANLNGLKKLWIFGAEQLGDRELEALRACKSLTELMLNGIGDGITDKGLAILAAMPRLERITIGGGGAGITPEGQAALRKAKPKTQITMWSRSADSAPAVGESTVARAAAEVPDLPLPEALAGYGEAKLRLVAAREVLRSAGLDFGNEELRRAYSSRIVLNREPILDRAGLRKAWGDDPETARIRREGFKTYLDAAANVVNAKAAMYKALTRRARAVYDREKAFTRTNPLPLLSLDDDLEVTDERERRYNEQSPLTGYDAVDLLVTFPRASLPLAGLRPEAAPDDLWRKPMPDPVKSGLWVPGGAGRIEELVTDTGPVRRLDGLSTQLVDASRRPGLYGGTGPEGVWQVRLRLRVPPGTEELGKVRGFFRFFRVLKEEEIVFRLPEEVGKIKSQNGAKLTLFEFDDNPDGRQINLRFDLPLEGLTGMDHQRDRGMVVPDLVRIVSVECAGEARINGGQGFLHENRGQQDGISGLFESYGIGKGIKSIRFAAAVEVETMDVPFVLDPVTLPVDSRLPHGAPVGPRGPATVDIGYGLELTLAPFHGSPRVRRNPFTWGNDRRSAISPLGEEVRQLSAKASFKSRDGGLLPGVLGRADMWEYKPPVRVGATTDSGEALAWREDGGRHTFAIDGASQRDAVYGIAIPMPSKPSDRLARLEATLPDVYFPTEYRVVEVLLNGEGQARAIDDPDLFVTKDKHGHNAFDIYFAPPKLPDNDLGWASTIQAVLLDEAGEPIPDNRCYGYAYKSHGPLNTDRVVGNERVKGPVVWLVVSAERAPAKVRITLPTAGEKRTLHATFTDVALPRRPEPPANAPIWGEEVF